jgi:hypothetical protein
MPQLGRTEGRVMAGGRYIEGAGTHTPLLYEGDPPDGALAGAPAGAVVIDVTTGDEYTNAGTAGAPVWLPLREDFAGDLALWTRQGSGATFEIVGGALHAANATADANTLILATPVAATSVISLRATLTVANQPSATDARLLRLVDEWSSLLADLRLTAAGALVVLADRQDGSGSQTETSAGGLIDPATAHVVELVRDNSGAQPVVAAYVDGALAVSIADATTRDAELWGTTVAIVLYADGVPEGEAIDVTYDSITLADALQGV